MLLVGFEPTISAGEWPQTYALDRAATGIGSDLLLGYKNCVACVCLDVSEDGTSSNSLWLNLNFLDVEAVGIEESISYVESLTNSSQS